MARAYLTVNPSRPLGIRLRSFRLPVLTVMTSLIVFRLARGWSSQNLPYISLRSVTRLPNIFTVNDCRRKYQSQPHGFCWRNDVRRAILPPKSPRYHARQFSVFMSAGDEDEVENDGSKGLTSTWNIPGLRKEVQRVILRCHKKIGKANERLTKARATVAQLTAPDATSTLEELENCPDMELLELELRELQARLQGLNTLNEKLQGIKKTSAVLPEDAATLALDLGVDDKPPARPQRGAPKPKGPRGGSTGPRKPYKCYYSFKNIEIRVGKKAEDNDELTMNPEHRDNADWWMHASGCPGSHVVIRCTEQTLPEEVIMDAASLAARQSKCSGSVIKVSLTRCRDIKKPPGAKAGLVMLTGNVRTVSVDMKQAAKRLQRLDESVVVN